MLVCAEILAEEKGQKYWKTTNIVISVDGYSQSEIFGAGQKCESLRNKLENIIKSRHQELMISNLQSTIKRVTLRPVVSIVL